MKALLVLLTAALVCLIPVAADLNVTISLDSDGGAANIWANPNTGTGTTTYYLDGVDYKQYTSAASKSRGAIISNFYKAFMQWKLQPSGRFGWQETEFAGLEPDFQRLRYVYETWFVPRSELIQIIQHQQAQITQLHLEAEAIEIVIGADVMCEARKQVMAEHELPSITCGDQTWYHNGIGLETIERGGTDGIHK